MGKRQLAIGSQLQGHVQGTNDKNHINKHRCVPVNLKAILQCIPTFGKRTGFGCSKLTMSLVNVSLKFQTLISEICQYFLLKKCEKLLHCKSFSFFFQQKISVYLVIKSYNN